MTEPTLDTVPAIGLGTWENTDPDQCAQSVRTAIDIGYRHIDTAQLYDNESAVGRGIRDSDVPRDELFLATKISFENLEYSEVLRSTRESLRKLETDYVDLLYVHWPAGDYDCAETLGAFEELKDQGMIRFVGVSNFTPSLLSESREFLEDGIYAHQVELHPLLKQDHLLEDANRHGTVLVAYSPFRHGTIFDRPELEQVADKHGVSPAQVVLAWIVDKENTVTIPKATGEDHLRENFEALDLEIDEEDRKLIESIDRVDRYIDPPFAPEWGS